MKLSIVFVNWRSSAWLRKSLLSIQSCPPAESYEILVVDNASEDECRRMLAAEFASVRYLSSGQNLGFARANNFGFRYSSGEYVLFLNPDTEVTGGALDELLFALKTLPKAGLVGAKLLSTDLNVQTSCVQRFPTILNQLFDAELMRRLWPTSRIFGIRPLVEPQKFPAEVECVSGACMLVRRKIFETVGGFSTQYFMYSEDVDLCRKVKHAGCRVYLVRTATVVHHGGSSSSQEPRNHFGAVAMRESRWLFMMAWHGPLYAALYRLTTGLSAALRLLMLAAAAAVAGNRRTRLRNSMNKWGRILRWSLWLNPWPQPGSAKAGLV